MPDKEEVLSQMAETVSHIRSKAEEFSKLNKDTREMLGEEKEEREKFKKAMHEIMAKQQQIKIAEGPTDNSAMSRDHQLAVETGFFGVAKPNFQRMMCFSPNHESIKGSRDGELLTRLQDHTDAAVIRYHYWRGRHDTTTAIDKLSKHPDTRAWAMMLRQTGYIQDVDAFLNPQSGMLAKVAQTRADEIMNPADTTAGYDNLTFELLSSQVLDQVLLRLVVAQNVTRIPLQRAQQKFPKDLTSTKGILGLGGINPPFQDSGSLELIHADANWQKLTFGSVQFDAVHCMSFLRWNDDMMEDSIVPWVPLMRYHVSNNVARAWDSAILNGDTTATHMDGTLATNDFDRAWDGIRHHTLSPDIDEATPEVAKMFVVDASGAAIGIDDIEAALKRMGKYALNTGGVTFMTSVGPYWDIVTTFTEVQTIDKWGPSATTKTGSIAQIYGMPIFYSEFYPTDLTADGDRDYGGTPGTLTGATMWRNDRYLLGVLDRVVVETTRWAPGLMNIIQADVRADFQPIEGPLATDTATAGTEHPAVSIINMLN